MKTKFTSTIITIALLFGLTSCPDDDYYPSTKRVYIHQIEVQNMDMAGAHPIESNTSISMKAYAIALFSMVSKQSKSENPNADLHLMINDEYHPDQRIKSTEIFCNRDFNVDHPAGSNIVELFDVGALPFGDYDKEAIHILYYVMINQPDNPGEYQFMIRYTFEDEVLEATTQAVELN